MTVEGFGPAERASRIWPIETGAPKDNRSDGPIALLKAAASIGWRYRTRLILCTMVGAIVAFAYAHSLPRTYNAAATMLLEPRYFSTTTGSVQQVLDLNSAESELQIILSERLLSSVFQSLRLADNAELAPQPPGLLRNATAAITRLIASLREETNGVEATDNQAGPSPQENRNRAAFANFTERVSARRVGQSYVVEIGYASSDPELSPKVANAVTSAYLMQSLIAKEQSARSGIDTLQGRLDSLAAQVNAADEAMREGTLPKSPTPDADAKITGAALYPLSPSSPKTALITAFGGLLGFFLSTAALALGIAFDRKVRSARDLGQETHSPCLGTIPQMPKGVFLGRRRRRAAEKFHADSLRDLRTSIDLAHKNKKLGRHAVIALTGCSKIAGDASLGVRLGKTMGKSGRTVTVFTASSLQHVEKSQSKSLTDVVTSVPVLPLRPWYEEGIAALPIYSSDASINATVDFCSAAVREVIDAARLNGEVILDLVALGASMDAVALAMHADIAIIVVQSGSTNREDFSSAEHRLRRSNVLVAGYVISGQRA